jgi:transcription antitermination factor NusG
MLLKAGIEAYLPLRKVLKYWSDRKKWVEEPLFRSYIFVHISEADYLTVLNVPGAVRYITFEGKAVPIPPQQIQAIKQFVATGEDLPEVDLQLSPGDSIDIIAGPMKGIEGTLVKIHGKKKVKIEISGLGRAVYLDLPASHIKGK